MKFNPNDPKHWVDFDPFKQTNEYVDGKSEQAVIIATANVQKGKQLSFREKMRQAKLGIKRPDMVGDNNIAKTQEERKRRSLAMTGVKKSQEQVEKYKESYKELPILKCPHCAVESQNQGNMNRYHFNNCSSNPKSPRYKKPNIVKTRKKQAKVKCPHCGKIGSGGAMKVHHFDNCKHK